MRIVMYTVIYKTPSCLKSSMQKSLVSVKSNCIPDKATRVAQQFRDANSDTARQAPN